MRALKSTVSSILTSSAILESGRALNSPKGSIPFFSAITRERPLILWGAGGEFERAPLPRERFTRGRRHVSRGSDGPEENEPSHTLALGARSYAGGRSLIAVEQVPS